MRVEKETIVTLEVDDIDIKPDKDCKYNKVYVDPKYYGVVSVPSFKEGLKVFANKREGGYSGGLIVVAATSIDEAHSIYHRQAKEFDLDWTFTMYKDSSGELVFQDGYYFKENWYELECVYATGEPRILAEDGHSE